MVFVLLFMLLGALGAPVAHAQEDADSPPARLVVETLSAVLRVGEPLLVRLQVTNLGGTALEPTYIDATVHRRVRSRLEYQHTVDDGQVGRVLQTAMADVGAVGPGKTVTVSLPSGPIALDASHDPYGVYPLHLALRRGEIMLDELVTSVIVVPGEVQLPLRASLLWPLDHPPGLLPDGSYREDLVVALGPGGRLMELLAAFGGAPGVAPPAAMGVATAPAITLAPSGLVLAQAADLADGFTAADGSRVGPEDSRAQQAATFLDRVAAVAGPGTGRAAVAYGPADLVALVRGDMRAEAMRHIEHSAATVAAVTGAPPVPGVLWPPGGLDDATTSVALDAGIDKVILAEDHVHPAGSAEQRYSPEPVRTLQTRAGASLTAFVPDPWLSQALAERIGAGHGEAVAVQRVVAETAVVYFERPYAGVSRRLLLAPPDPWHFDPRVAAPLAGALASAPWLQLVPLSALSVGFDGPRAELRYSQESREQELTGAYMAELRAARHELGVLASVLAERDGTAPFLDRLLLAAASLHYRSAHQNDEGLALIRMVADTLGRAYGAIAVVDSPPITLTSAEGVIPVTLRNTGPAPLSVRVRLATPRYEFKGGPLHTPVRVPPGSTTTLTFAVRALSPGGTNPIGVVVEDPTGGLVLARGTIVVRSTAYSLVTLLITGGAGVFLLVWWIRDAAQRRRPRSGSGDLKPVRVGPTGAT